MASRNLGRLRVSREVAGLGLEPNVKLVGGDIVMKHNVTGLCRLADDLPNYTLIGECDQFADSTGKAPGEITINVIQGEYLIANDPANPVTNLNLLTGNVYVTASRTVASTSVNKVPGAVATNVSDTNGGEVTVLISAGF